MWRPVALACCAVALTGCGSATDHESQPEQPASSPSSCAPAPVVMRQGSPTDLPGGGSAGFTSIDTSTQPPTVRLMIGAGGDSQAPPHASVGDTFTAGPAAYKILCISASEVTAEQVEP